MDKSDKVLLVVGIWLLITCGLGLYTLTDKNITYLEGYLIPTINVINCAVVAIILWRMTR